MNKEEQLFFKAEETEWQFLAQRLFPTGLIPERTKWTNLKTIVDIFIVCFIIFIK